MLKKKLQEVSSKKEIIFIIDSPFPYYSGGRETWLFHICNSLITNGDSIYLVNQKKFFNMKKPFFNLNSKVNIISVPILPRFIKTYWPLGTLFRVANSYLFSILCYIKLFRRFRRKKPLIIAIGSGFTALPALYLKKQGYKYICCVRGKYAYDSTLKTAIFKKKWFNFFQKLEIKTMKHAEAVWANGYDTKENISKYIDQNTKKKVSVMPNGVDFQKYKSGGIIKENIIMNVSTLRDITGIREIIKCIPHVVNKNVKFVFVGKGNKEPYVKLAKKLNVLNSILFLGERKDIPDVLKQAKIVLCVSDGSGISHSLLEALSSGAVVIAWDYFKYSQLIVNRKSGFLVEENNPAKLGEMIEYVLENYDKMGQIRINARKSVEKYDWKNVTQRFFKKIKPFI